MTRDQRLYFPAEGNHPQDFYALKISLDPGRMWTREPRIQWRVWQPLNHRGRRKESHRCYLLNWNIKFIASLAMGDSGTSTVLTRYVSMRLRSLPQNERIIARDPVQHKRLTYPTVSTEHQQRCTRWWCTSGVVKTPENGYWVSRATSHTLQGLEGRESNYVVAYSCWLLANLVEPFMGKGIIFTHFENFARCLKIWNKILNVTRKYNCHANDYDRKRNRNGGAVSNFMLILKTCKLLQFYLMMNRLLYSFNLEIYEPNLKNVCI